MVIVTLAVTISLLAILERSPRFRFRPQKFLRPYFTSDVVYLATGFVAGTSLSLAYILAASKALGDQLGLPRLAATDPPLWLTVPLALVAIDAGNYFSHWLLHRVAALWEFHKVHHSSPQLDWLAAFRSHLVEQTVRRLVAPLLLILFGFPTIAVVLAGAIFTSWAAVIHSNLRFQPRWLEWLIVTPRLHRTHHNAETSEKNLGNVLTLWDRLRGTFESGAASDPDHLGVPGEVTTYPQGWWRQLAQPLRTILAEPRSVSAVEDGVLQVSPTIDHSRLAG